MAIYTRTGDRGETGLSGGQRVSKGSMQISVIGSVDELNSTLGLVIAMAESVLRIQNTEYRIQNNKKSMDIGLAKLVGQLRDIQRELFEMGAAIAAQSKSTEFSDTIKEYGVDGDQKSEASRKRKSLKPQYHLIRGRQVQDDAQLETRNLKLETRQMQRMAEDFVRGGKKESSKGLGELVEREQDAGQTMKRVEDAEKQGLFDAKRLETLIDEMEQDLPRIVNFILPGGGVVGAQLMVARAVCRRTEREFVRYIISEKRKVKSEKQQHKNKNLKLPQKIELETRNLKLETDILRYLNRLSDYLFVASRWVNWLMEEEEIAWRRK